MSHEGSQPDAPPTGAQMARTWLRVIFAAAAVGVILAVSGGFGSQAMKIAPRTLYWLALTAVGAALGILASRLVVPRRWFVSRPWLAWGLIVACIVPPVTVLVAILDGVIAHRSIRWALLLEALPGTAATTAAVTALAFLVRDRGPRETHAAAAGAPPPKFLARMPAKLAGAEIWAVEAQDHYLRLHTSKGRDLILMRLTDAIAELDGIEGARTHRSWWVARAAVAETERAEGRATLTLVDGSEAPVSRGYVATLRAAGWL